VEEVAVAEDDVGWGKYLWIRVVIDLFKPLEQGRALLLTGASCWVSFKYEKLPTFCYRCGRILHDQKGCLIKSLPKQSQLPAWGSWLGAEDLVRGLEANRPDWQDHPDFLVDETTEPKSQATRDTKKASTASKGNTHYSAPKKSDFAEGRSLPKEDDSVDISQERKGGN
jgi:hypothetical protein